MPEPYWPKHKTPYMLSQAAKSDGALVKASCIGCSKPRWYLPADLIQLLGDVPAMNLGRIMRCEVCGDEMNADVTHPPTAERLKITLRRIDKIWWVRRVRWRDEKL